MKIILAKPRGFCAGVKRAIEITNLALKKFGQPIYVKHDLVHNDFVISDFKKRGVIFENSLDKIPDGSIVIFSAHGSPPGDYLEARKRNIKVIDATCPLVAKVHLEAKLYIGRGYKVVLLGHKNHVEVIGTKGEAPDSIFIIETDDDIKKLDFSTGAKLAILAQTTLAQDEIEPLIKSIQKKFPRAILPPGSDVCYATINRQQAARSLAKISDLVFVVGSAASSNTKRLVEVVARTGTRAFRINDCSAIKRDWLDGVNIVGITAGASAPEKIVSTVIGQLEKYGFTEVEEKIFTDERVNFNLPKFF